MSTTIRPRLAKIVLLSLVVLFIIVVIVTLRSPTSRIVAKAGETIAKPEFPFEVVRETVYSEYSARSAYVFMPGKYYSEQNVIQLFRWYSHTYCSDKDVSVWIFTDRGLAEDTSWELQDTFKWRTHLLKMTPFKATFLRRCRYSNRTVNEEMTYRPISWFPLWTRSMIFKESVPFADGLCQNQS